MGAQIRLLDSTGVGELTSFNLGTTLQGSQSSPKLVFANSFGDETCVLCEVGVDPVSGSDGSSMIETCLAETFSMDGVTPSAAVSAGGSIQPSTIYYAVTARDMWGHESSISVVLPVTIADANSRVSLSWTAAAGTTKYFVYSGNSAASLKLSGESSSNSFVDVNGTNDGATEPPVTGSVSHRPTVWQTALLSLGDMAPGTSKPVMVRDNVPAGTTSAGNPRLFDIFVRFMSGGQPLLDDFGNVVYDENGEPLFA